MEFTKDELLAIKELLENATVQVKSATKALELLNKIVGYIDEFSQPSQTSVTE